VTIRAFEAQASWLPTVVGLTCDAVRSDGETLVSLYFGELREVGEDEPEAERIISISGAWRIEQGEQVLAGADDPDDEREEYIQELVGRELERYEVSRPGYDLALFLSEGIVVRCFPIDSLEYATEVDDPEEVEISWWVDGDGVPDDWETGRDDS
jgi:hypothetical protein